MNERCVHGSLVHAGASLLGLLLLFSTPKLFAFQMPIVTGASPKPANADVKVPVFDVASVKENKGDGRMMRVMTKPDGFECENISLQTLIANAYGIKQDLISGGPSWAESKGFDINAKVAGPDVELLKKLKPEQRASMLQPLLAERFHLKVHIETKVLPTYDLTVAKGGPKMKESAPDPPPADGEKDDESHKRGGSMRMFPGELTGQDLPMDSLAGQLSYLVHRTVNDKTGLTGKYDLTLKYTSEDSPQKDDGTTGAPPPFIFTAVQEQLGLKLVSTKGPVETLIIDSAELPSEN